MGHHKRKRPKNRRAGCLLCKPWKVNGFAKDRVDAEPFSDHRRRNYADRELQQPQGASWNFGISRSSAFNNSVGAATAGRRQLLKLFSDSNFFHNSLGSLACLLGLIVVVLVLGACATSDVITVDGITYGVGITYDIRGQLQGNLYVSPNRAFQVQIPPLVPAFQHGGPIPSLVKPGAKVQDRVSNGHVLVSLSDDFCRNYQLESWPDNLGDLSLTAWFEKLFFPSLQARSGLLILERSNVETKFGPAIYLHVRYPGGAPCTVTTGGITTRPDAFFAMYVFHKGGYFYLVGYLSGGAPTYAGPAEENLRRFFDSFQATPERAK